MFTQKLIDRIQSLPGMVPSVELVDRAQAIHTILTADLRALPIAWQAMRDAYGRTPMSLGAWAAAIDAAYLSGF